MTTTVTRWRRVAAGLALAVLVVVAGCAAKPPADAAATYDGGFVSARELQRYLGWLDSRNLRTRSQVDAQAGVEGLLADLAFLEILAAEAPAEPNADPPLLYLEPRAAFLAQYYVERKGKRTHEISDAEAQELYQARLGERFTVPESITFQHVFLRADRHSAEELTRIATTVRDLLVQGTPFAEVAASYSESESARWQGTVGPVYRGRMDAGFEQALYRLQPGRPAVIRTSQGAHVVVVVELRPSRQLPFEEVKQQIVSVIMDKRNETEREQLLAELRARYGVLDRSADTTVGADEVALRVKDRELTRAQLERYLAPRIERLGGQGGADSGLRQRLVDELVTSNLLYLDAVDSGFDEEDTFVDRWAMHELRQRADVAKRLRLHAWTEQVGDDVVLRYLEENQGRFAVPQRFNASYLVLPLGSGPPFELQLRIEALAELAATPGTDDGELERRCAQAGVGLVHMGWATPTDAAGVGPEFQRRLLAMEAPGSTGVFRDEQRLHAIQVHAIEGRRKLTEPADHDLIRARYAELHQEKAGEEIQREVLAARHFRVLSTAVFEPGDGQS